MEKLTFFLILFFSCQKMIAQKVSYQDLVKEADASYNAKNYLESAKKYSAAFIVNHNKGMQTDRYNAACSWALAGYVDSAFFQLNIIAEKTEYADYQYIQKDEDLASLHNDSRWLVLLAMVKKNYDLQNNYSNKALRKLIDSLRDEDQKWRNLAVNIRNGAKNDSLTEKQAWAKVGAIDSVCYPVLKRIAEKYGFPNSDLVGVKGSNNFWLLMQHQDEHPDFQEKVLDMMKVEVDKNKASSKNYAYLVDRVRVNTKKPQVYGTQLTINKDGTSHEIQNTEDPAKLNERRASVGLGPIEEYIESTNKLYHGSLKNKN
jgi:hypothetical protein